MWSATILGPVNKPTGSSLPRILDVGCGRRKTPGAIGMDVLADSSADVVADLNDRWPFDDCSFDSVVAHHVLEHVPDVPHVMAEAWRVLVPGGLFVVHGPHFSSPYLVWSDPTHRRGLSLSMFSHFLPDAGLSYARASFAIRRAHLHSASARRSPSESWWRKASRPFFVVYERQLNRSTVAQHRAERIWSRFLNLDELAIELVAVK